MYQLVPCTMTCGILWTAARIHSLGLSTCILQVTYSYSNSFQVVDVGIRQLTEVGVFTVFIILDTQAKVKCLIHYNNAFVMPDATYMQDSITDIKVPLFSPGKVHVPGYSYVCVEAVSVTVLVYVSQ